MRREERAKKFSMEINFHSSASEFFFNWSKWDSLSVKKKSEKKNRRKIYRVVCYKLHKISTQEEKKCWSEWSKPQSDLKLKIIQSGNSLSLIWIIYLLFWRFELWINLIFNSGVCGFFFCSGRELYISCSTLQRMMVREKIFSFFSTLNIQESSCECFFFNFFAKTTPWCRHYPSGHEFFNEFSIRMERKRVCFHVMPGINLNFSMNSILHRNFSLSPIIFFH